MRLLRAMSRSLLALTAIVTVSSTLLAQAADTIRGNSSLANQRLVFTPKNLNFGKVVLGLPMTHTITITNWSASKITLLEVLTEGDDFTITGLDLPLMLQAGESFTFSSVFEPRSRGDRSGRISFVSDASNEILGLALKGTGEDSAGLVVNPTTLNFGDVQIGTNATQEGILSAAATVTISSAISDNPEFVLGGLSFPLTIPAGGAQAFTVTFTPQNAGAQSGTLSFLGAATDGPLAIETLNGVGVVSQGHSVSLSWNASTSQNVIGYNVYRGTQSGGPYTRINPELDPNLDYTDIAVIDGQTYFYVTTSVNSENEESVYSNQAQATIPSSPRNTAMKISPSE
jgi:hypothetical protein